MSLYAKSMQAVVLVGGNASRLKASGVPVPLSKSFMELNGEPLLYWNLTSLFNAGVRNLILVGNEVRHLYAAKKVIKKLPCTFYEVIYFCDEGSGAHGIPYELRYLLHETYIFECGHGLSEAAHYKRLTRAKQKHAVVFSAYDVRSSNIRQPVSLHRGIVKAAKRPGKAIAHPIVADKKYAESLLRFGFKISTIINSYAARNALGYIKNSLPPEYDVKDEMATAYQKYSAYIRKSLLL